MATVRETIEIVLSGGQKVDALKNQLLAAANAAAALADQVGEIDNRLKGVDQEIATFGRNSATLSRTAKVISGELGRESDYQRRRRSAQDRIRALRQSGQFSQARSATERLEGRDQQRVRLRESARLINAELAERKRILAELVQVRGTVEREKIQASARQRLAVKLAVTDQAILERQQASLREARGSLARGARRTVAETRERSTDVLFRRRSAQANRLLTSGQSGGLSKARRAELERLSGEIDQVRDRFATLNDGLRALRETAKQSGESPAKINQQARAFAAARRETAVELGRLVQDLLEVNRTARGSRRNFDKGRRLAERVNELARVGAVDPEGSRKLISRIGAAGSARAKGNIQEAQDLLEKAETTISAKERQLKIDRKLQQEARQQVRANETASASAVAREKQRQSALTQESKALNVIRVQQQQIADLASKPGATGLSSFQRASGAVARLPQLLEAGDLNEFNRVLGDATAFSRIVRSELGVQARAATARTKDEKEIQGINKKILSGKRLEASEVDRLNALRPPASALPALPAAAPGAAALGGRARPLRTRSTVGGVVQPLIQEILGGGRTIEDAELSKRFADSFATKAGKKAGPKFAQVFVAGAADSFSAKQLLSGIGAAFGVLSEKSLSKTASQAVKLESGIAGVADALVNAAKANESVERAAARAAAVQAGLYDDSDLKQFVEGLLQTEKVAGDYLDKLKQTFSFQDQQRKAEEKGANNRETALDRELDRRLKLEKRQEALLRLEEQRPGSAQAERARSLFDRLSSLGTSGRQGEFTRVDKELAQVLSMAGVSRKKGGVDIGPLPTGQLALPDEKLLNATGRGIKRLTTIQEEFDRRVQSGTRFQQKFNQEQERLRKLYGTAAPQGLTLARGSRAAGPRPLDPQAAQQRLARDLLAGQNLVGKLENLERKRVAGFGAADPRTIEVSQQVVRLETQLNAAKQAGFELTKQNLDALTATVNKSRQLLDLDAQQNKLSAETAKIRRLQGERRLPQLQRESLTSILGELGRSETASKVFRGGRSGEQALSSIVGAFNAAVGGKTAGAGRGGLSNAVSGAAETGTSIVETFANKLAGGSSSAAAAATKFASAATKAIDKVFGRNSPPKFILKLIDDIIAATTGKLAQGAPAIEAAFSKAFGAGASAVERTAKTVREVAATALLNLPSTNPQAGIAGQFDFGARRPSLGADYGTLSQAIADLTIDPAKYRRRIDAVGLQNFPTELLRESSARGTFQDVFPELKLERVFRNLPGLLEKQIDDAFVKSANRFSSTRFTLSSMSPAAGQAREQSILNPGILMSQSGRFRARRPSTAAGFSSPLFGAPGGSFLPPIVDPRFSASPFSFGGRPPAPPTQPPAERPEDRINAARGDVDKLLGLKDLASLSAASANQLELLSQALSETRNGLKMTDKGFDQLTKVLNKVDDQIARRDPNADLLTRGFGQRGGQALGEGLIGGAFPLLFGQGLGAAALGGLGGALGGFAGGTLGFGLSLAGTAIGSSVDALAQAAQDTGNLLRDLTGNFEQIKESGLLASRGQEKLIANLLEAGNKTAAYAVIQDQLNQKLGVSGTAKLREAADAGDRMRRAMAELGVQMQILISGPLTDLLNRISGAVEDLNAGTRAERTFQLLTPDQRASAESRLLSMLPESQARNVRAESQRIVGSSLSISQLPQAGITGAGGAFVPGELSLPITQQGSTGGARARTSTSEFAELIKLLPSEQRSTFLSGLEALIPSSKQSPEQQRQQAVNDAETLQATAQRRLDALTKRNESADILKGFKQQANAIRREQEDIDRQSFELRRDYEKQIEDIRRGVEDKISQLRQENAQKELEILVKQGQVREQQFQNAALALQGALAGDPLAQSLADAVTTYLGAQLSAQNEIEQRRKQFEIEISNQQVELEKYKADVARSVAQLNLSTAEKVQEINRSIARRNEDSALNTFAAEKKIAKLKAEVIQNELLVMQARQKGFVEQSKVDASQNPGKQVYIDIRDANQAIFDNITENIKFAGENLKAIEATQAPPKLREIPTVSAKGVSFAGVNAQKVRGDQLRNQFQAVSDELSGLVKSGNLQEFANRISEIASGSFFELSNGLETARKELALLGGDFGPIADGIKTSYQDLIKTAAQQGKPFPQAVQDFLLNDVVKAQIAYEKLRPTLQFYADGFQDLRTQTDQARASISELLAPSKNYDRVLQDINKRGGIGINEEYNRSLLQAAKNLDELNARIKVLNGLRDIASGWTDSFIQLNKELLKGGNLLESVQRFAESVADRTLDVVLEFTLRPIQEQLFKNLTSFLGIEAPQDPTLLPIKETAANTKGLLDIAKGRFAGKTGVALPQAVPAAAPANAIVPGPSAAKVGGPLGELLARIRSAEGNYTSANRGFAGDTPGGIPNLVNMTVAQVMSLQKNQGYNALGAYQFIPRTLEGAVSRSGVDLNSKFDERTQDNLALELILGGVKRPALSDYLQGRSNDINAAERDALLEWAGLKSAKGGGMYDGVAGNRGSVTIRDLLPLIRQQLSGGGATYIPPTSRSGSLTPGSSPNVEPAPSSLGPKSSAMPIGDQFLSQILGSQFEDMASTYIGAPGSRANRGSLRNGLDAFRRAGASAFGVYRGNPNDIKLIQRFFSQNPAAANQYDLPVNFFLRYLSGAGAKQLEFSDSQGRTLLKAIREAEARYSDPANVNEFLATKNPAARRSFESKIKQGYLPIDYPELSKSGALQDLSFSFGRFWARRNKDRSYSIEDTYDFNDLAPGARKLGEDWLDMTPSGVANRLRRRGKPFNLNLRVLPSGQVEVDPSLGPQSSSAIGEQFTAMLSGSRFANIASTKGPGMAYPLPNTAPSLAGGVAPVQVVPYQEPTSEVKNLGAASSQAATSLTELEAQASTAADKFQDVGASVGESVTKFQQIVGTGLQAITSVAMGIGGAQMIRKGGTYNTLMGAASIFGSIGSIAGMFGGGGKSAGVKAPPGFDLPMLSGIPGYASGGRPDPFMPALIGEEGPELWVPDRPGTIIPNDELYVPGLDDKGGSAPPIGRYSRRAAANLDTTEGNSERSVYSETYERGPGSTTYVGNYGRSVPYQRSETTREIDRLERVTSSPKELPPIKYETTRVNEYEFVTPEQLEASNARTAKIARNQTIRELADSMKTRKRLGL